jgi:hypothetical protein
VERTATLLLVLRLHVFWLARPIVPTAVTIFT